MQSQNLDETSPTFVKPEGSDVPEAESDLTPRASPAEQGSDLAATQPMIAIPDGTVPEPEAADMPGDSSQPAMPEELSIDESFAFMIDENEIIPPAHIPEQPAYSPKGSRMWILWAFLGVLILALIAGGSAYAGYNSAVEQRTQFQSTLVAGEATNQYILAQEDIAKGNYDRARQRLEYIIQIDPNYPNVADQLAFVLTQQRITATPTLASSPTLTPTPDYRGRDDLFTEAQAKLVGRDWTGTIDTLLLLRKNFPDYMAVQVDGMLFVALRNRGIDKIYNQHDLEGGNYDLTLAELFGPLDSEARNWRDWADLYIRGASFWDVDWAQSIYYFSTLANAAPNLSDASGWTAYNRYLDAILGYGDWLAAKGLWCEAQTQYDTYMSLLASTLVEPTAMYAAEQCIHGVITPGTPVVETPTPIGTPPAVATPTPTGTPPAVATPTPTETPSAGVTPYP